MWLSFGVKNWSLFFRGVSLEFMYAPFKVWMQDMWQKNLSRADI